MGSPAKGFALRVGVCTEQPPLTLPLPRGSGALCPRSDRLWGHPWVLPSPAPSCGARLWRGPNPILSTQPGVPLSVHPSIRPGVSVCLCTPRGSAPPQHPPLCPCVRLCVRVSEHIPHQGPRSGCPSGSGGRGVIGVRWQLRAARVGTTAVRGDGAGAAGRGRGGLRSGVLPRKTSSCGGRRR